MNTPLEGFLILDKSPGWTSQRAVHRLKRLFGWAKAGHTGTLDPLATGVLPVAWGEATKVIPYLDESLKVYEVEGRLGEATSTYDAEGEVTERRDYTGVKPGDILGALAGFLGEIQQRPPAFSAVKIQGRPAYRMARRGEPVVPPARAVQIHSLELLNFSSPVFRLRVSCGRGTYIRSLVHDLGLMLGPGAHVSSLRRLQTGPFRLENAVPWEDLEGGKPLEHHLVSIEEALAKVPQLSLVAGEKKLVQGGNLPHRIENLLGDHYPCVFSLTEGGRILALTARKSDSAWKLERVLRRS